MMGGDVTLSVRVITYNQAAFVGQALDSALAQRVEFPYEIVVGDDGSTDGTRDILLDYQRRHPDRLRVLLADRNHGGRWNFVRTLEACRGRYVAMLDGDDYWTAPDKLARQVAFLERRPQFSICFHDVLVTYADGRPPHRYCERRQRRTSTLAHLVTDNFIPTCSVVMRRPRLPLPDWFHEAPAGDTPLYLLAAREGQIGYLADVLAVYRIHGGNMTLNRSPERHFGRAATMFARLAPLLGPDHEAAIRARVCRHFVSTFFSPEHARDWRHRRPDEIARSLQSWPPELPLRDRERRRLLGRCCLRVAEGCLRAGDRARARGWLAHAARLWPGQVAGTTFWFTGIAAYLGDRPTLAVRGEGASSGAAAPPDSRGRTSCPPRPWSR